MRNFLICLLLAAGLMVAGVYGGLNAGYYSKPTFYGETLILLFVMTAVIYRYLSRAGKPQGFLQLYLFTMLIKLVGYCGYALFMILRDKSAAFANAVFFMVAYFVFTTVEVVFLYRKISNDQRP